jgi:hypothetical protein
VILPVREATLNAAERQFVTGDSINALDLHVVDDGGDLPALIDAKLAATFFPDIDKRPSLAEGSGETMVDPEARTLEVRHPKDYCEKVDEVSLRDSQGHWVEKTDAEGRDTCG